MEPCLRLFMYFWGLYLWFCSASFPGTRRLLSSRQSDERFWGESKSRLYTYRVMSWGQIDDPHAGYLAITTIQEADCARCPFSQVARRRSPTSFGHLV